MQKKVKSFLFCLFYDINYLIEYYGKLGFKESNEQLDTFHKRI